MHVYGYVYWYFVVVELSWEIYFYMCTRIDCCLRSNAHFERDKTSTEKVERTKEQKEATKETRWCWCDYDFSPDPVAVIVATGKSYKIIHKKNMKINVFLNIVWFISKICIRPARSRRRSTVQLCHLRFECSIELFALDIVFFLVLLKLFCTRFRFRVRVRRFAHIFVALCGSIIAADTRFAPRGDTSEYNVFYSRLALARCLVFIYPPGTDATVSWPWYRTKFLVGNIISISITLELTVFGRHLKHVS